MIRIGAENGKRLCVRMPRFAAQGDVAEGKLDIARKWRFVPAFSQRLAIGVPLVGIPFCEQFGETTFDREDGPLEGSALVRRQEMLGRQVAKQLANLRTRRQVRIPFSRRGRIVQPFQQTVQGEAAAARVDFGFDRFLRFDSEHLRQQEAERTGRVTLKLCRAELVVAAKEVRDALPVRLALKHAFVCRESCLLVPRGRHLGARQDRARRGRPLGPFGQQAKESRFLLADLRCCDETQIGPGQRPLARRDRIEVARRSDAKRFCCEETAYGRHVGTCEERLTRSAHTGKAQRQPAACAGHDGIEEQHFVLLRRRGGRGSPRSAGVTALGLRVEAVIQTRAGKTRFGQTRHEEVRNVEIAYLCRLEEEDLADRVIGGGKVLRFKDVLESVHKLA